MSSSTQRIPLGDCNRLTLDVTSADVVVSWREDIDEIVLDTDDVTVDRGGDELFLRVDLSGFQIDIGDEETEIRISGLESPGQMVEDILKRTGLFSGIGRSKPRATLNVDLPRQLRTSELEVENGSLRLVNPQRTVECTLKRGDFSSDGGDGDLTVSGGPGKIRIASFTGSLQVAGGSGDVSLIDVEAVTNVAAGSGEVTLHRVAGEAIKIAAGSGDIMVKHSRAAAYNSDCGSGDVFITGGAFERMKVRSGSGDIRCTARLGDCDQSFETGSGSITLAIHRDASARIEAFTSSGDIKTNLPLVSVGQRGPKSRRSRRQVGSVGESDERAEVSVRSSSGDIQIHWLAASEGDAIPMPPPVPNVPEVPDVPPVPEVQSIGTSTGTSHQSSDPDRDTREVLDALSRGDISVEEAEALLASIQQRSS